MKAGTQLLRAVNRIPISSAALELASSSPLAGHVSAGLQIHHPKGNKRLTSVLHFNLSKPKNARVVLTIHHGEKTKTVRYPFGNSVRGNQKVTLQMTPQEGMAGVHHVSIYGFVQRKNSAAKVGLTLKRIDVSS